MIAGGMSYVAGIRTYVRVYDLGNMAAAARDLRVSAAVVSNRIGELEKHLGVRLFNRTTRSLIPTEHGRLFYTSISIALPCFFAKLAAADATAKSCSPTPVPSNKVISSFEERPL